ncbi:MAG: GxxExxY protein, partial [Caldilineaceae bacterium]|nr:GxxExxY protein [Caldilineaceae bacterium]
MQNENLTFKIIGCAFKVHNALGAGFLEKVYENALRMELVDAGLKVQQQVPIHV